ncbi:hypothetical protein [Paenibacillus agricola]|uniref:Uncharacterized protein n=1 Tax=Paenibacillus agricola TaxID=2716264 RepID=A0ABX0J6T2_9BACL|nr:hypothetical protein [Paenibacillus agricola]NHN31120.1 hypothetical protein [Paenibacillus agricola]
MSTNKTANLNLHSWTGTDYVLRTEFNENFDKIDAVLPYSALSRQAIINGNFDAWQRGTTLTNPSSVAYLADRWKISQATGGGTFPTNVVHSRQTLTPGDIDKSFFFYRIAPDGAGAIGASSFYQLAQPIENGTRYMCGASKKVAISFYARSSIANKRMGIDLLQNYGTGGSPSAQEVINGTNFILTSTWQKFTFTFTTNTLAGKTFGTNNDDYLTFELWNVWGASLQSRVGASTAEGFGAAGTIDIAQVQLCSGDVALPFQPRNFADELTLCQRYYEKSYSYTNVPATITQGGAILNTTVDNTNVGIVYTTIPFKVRKRGTPTVTIYGTDSGAANTVSDGASDKTIASGSVANPFETSFQQNYALTGATTTLRRFHFTADAEI